jgi:hypothetical protein
LKFYLFQFTPILEFLPKKVSASHPPKKRAKPQQACVSRTPAWRKIFSDPTPTQRDTKILRYVYVASTVRIVRNAQAHERHSLQTGVAANLGGGEEETK